jgi:hypothetical protein
MRITGSGDPWACKACEETEQASEHQRNDVRADCDRDVGAGRSDNAGENIKARGIRTEPVDRLMRRAGDDLPQQAGDRRERRRRFADLEGRPVRIVGRNPGAYHHQHKRQDDQCRAKTKEK